jgi:hypothetical protein
MEVSSKECLDSGFFDGAIQSFRLDYIRCNPSNAGTNRLVQTSRFRTRLRTACSHHMNQPDAHADKGGDAFLQKDYLTFACSRRVCALRIHYRLR